MADKDHLVLDKVGVDQRIMVYPLVFMPRPPPPLHLLPTLLLPPTLLVILRIPRSLLWYPTLGM